MNMIQTENIFKNYLLGKLEVKVLKEINLNIKKGEFTSIIGKSGSGKSTLMHILGCLDVPTSGKYFLDGIEVSSLNLNKLASVRNKKIGFVFQNFNLLPRLTALENVEMPLLYAGLNQAKDLAYAALKKVGLEDRVHHQPNQLSGGQRQRVSIARALVNNPEIIMADEPTGNLDTKSAAQVIDLFKEISSEGKTVIFVTHDNDIASICERIIRIEDGRIAE